MIDDLICRDRGSERLYVMQDSNWNVIGLVDRDGAVSERVRYSAFGAPEFMDADYVSKTGSDYGWTRTFTGQVYDAETGLMLYRNRFYSPDLGRFVTPSSSIQNLFRSNDKFSQHDLIGPNSQTGLTNQAGSSSQGNPGSNSFSFANNKPTDSGQSKRTGEPDSKGTCRVAVHCWQVWKGYIPTLQHHCGLTVERDGQTITYDGSGGDINQFHKTGGPTTRTTTYNFVEYDSSVCDCIEKYTERFNKEKIPRGHLAGNSNWSLSCVVGRCALSAIWEGIGKPIGYDSPPCKRTKIAYGPRYCPEVCAEWYTCPK